MAGDWIKVHRQLMDSAVWTDEWLVKLWIWCLLKANYRDGFYKGKPVKRGQFVTGRITGADELNVSPSRWYRGITRLAELGGIEIHANSVWTMITVCNYTTYQDTTGDDRTANEQRMNSEWTANGQPADTIEEGKKGRTVQNRTEQKRRASKKPDWTEGDARLADLASQQVHPLPTGPVDKASVFSVLTAEMLHSPPTIVGWFRRQLSASEPVLRGNQADLMLAICSAMRACEKGVESPVGLFVSCVTRRTWKDVSRYRDKAETIIKEVLAQ
jgi:hypothetical protein